MDREGKWTATQVFLCHRNSITQLMPRPGTPHPEIPFISVDNATAQVSEGDIAQITCNYAGTDNTTNDPNKTSYTLGLSLSEEPLLSHKKFKDLAEEEIEALQAIISGKERIPPVVLQGQDHQRPRQEGVGENPARTDLLLFTQSHLAAVHREKASAASSDVNKIGQIDQPDGRQPNVGDGRTWLLNGVTQTQEGSAYRIEREWIASDAGGWDTDIYNL